MSWQLSSVVYLEFLVLLSMHVDRFFSFLSLWNNSKMSLWSVIIQKLQVLSSIYKKIKIIKKKVPFNNQRLLKFHWKNHSFCLKALIVKGRAQTVERPLWLCMSDRIYLGAFPAEGICCFVLKVVIPCNGLKGSLDGKREGQLFTFFLPSIKGLTLM